MRAYVRAGGRVAWLGTGGFTRPVSVRGSARSELRWSDRGQKRCWVSACGLPSGRPLTVLGDRIDFFAGGSDAFGPFPLLEPSERLPPAAGCSRRRATRRASFAVVVYRPGKGVVVRVGVDGFARAALHRRASRG